jgi:hypothetical protein
VKRLTKLETKLLHALQKLTLENEPLIQQERAIRESDERRKKVRANESNRKESSSEKT